LVHWRRMVFSNHQGNKMARGERDEGTKGLRDKVGRKAGLHRSPRSVPSSLRPFVALSLVSFLILNPQSFPGKFRFWLLPVLTQSRDLVMFRLKSHHEPQWRVQPQGSTP
jgi:hypothetical protein